MTGRLPEGRERTRALSIFTAVMMGGASLGLVLGGMMTEWASWRWVFFINVPIGLLSLLLTSQVVQDPPHLKGTGVRRALAARGGDGPLRLWHGT